MKNELLEKTLAAVADFFDERKVGHLGPLGFRRSSDLSVLLSCVDLLLHERIVRPGKTLFFDLGCGDGRVNLFLSYLVKISVGVELDDWTLDEYFPLREELNSSLEKKGLLSLPSNTFLYHGNSMDETVFFRIKEETGLVFEEFDLFYTYLVMQEEFAGMIAEKAKKDAIFIVYGLNRILPTFKGLELLDELSPMGGFLGIYRKK